MNKSQETVEEAFCPFIPSSLTTSSLLKDYRQDHFNLECAASRFADDRKLGAVADTQKAVLSFSETQTGWELGREKVNEIQQGQV